MERARRNNKAARARVVGREPGRENGSGDVFNPCVGSSFAELTEPQTSERVKLGWKTPEYYKCGVERRNEDNDIRFRVWLFMSPNR